MPTIENQPIEVLKIKETPVESNNGQVTEPIQPSNNQPLPAPKTQSVEPIESNNSQTNIEPIKNPYENSRGKAYDLDIPLRNYWQYKNNNGTEELGRLMGW